MNQRKINGNWITEYLKFTKEQEAPGMFHLWVAISVIASALERNVHLDRGYYTLYPNLYIVLVAESEVCMKTTAADIGIEILKKIENPPAIFAQKITPEALVSGLCNECAVDEAGVVYKNASAVIYSEELSVFLGREAYASGMVSILTSLYGCRDVWEYETIGRGKDIAYNTCINLLGASTPEWLRMSIPVDAVGGGFTSRIVFVYQDASDKENPHPEITEEEVELRKNLIHDLSLIRRINGVFKFTPSSKEWYAKWYHGYRKAQAEGKPTMVRKKDLILKVAMCMSAAEDDSLIITEEHLSKATEVLDSTECYLPEAMRILSSTQVGVDANKVATIIKKYENGIMHDELMRATVYTLDKTKLTEIVETLLSAKIISVELVGDKNERKYTYNETRISNEHFADKFQKKGGKE